MDDRGRRPVPRRCERHATRTYQKSDVIAGSRDESFKTAKCCVRLSKWGASGPDGTFFFSLVPPAEPKKHVLLFSFFFSPQNEWLQIALANLRGIPPRISERESPLSTTLLTFRERERERERGRERGRDERAFQRGAPKTRSDGRGGSSRKKRRKKDREKAAICFAIRAVSSANKRARVSPTGRA